MKAITVTAAGGPEVLEVSDIPEPQVKSGEVKIKIKAFGLNRAETYYRAGNYGTLLPGRVPGIEAVGEVVADPSEQFKLGQKVVTVMGGMMFGRDGSYAEYTTVELSQALAIDSDIDFIKLAALPEAYLTVWGSLDYDNNLKAGETLLVRGATSAVGLAAVTYAKARGLSVIATTRNVARRERLIELGADHVIIDSGEIAENVRDIIPDGVDKVLEVVGAPTVKDSLKAVKLWGEVVVIGLLGGVPVLEQFGLMSDLPNTVKLSFFSSGLLGSEQLPLAKSPLNWIANQVHQGLMPDITSEVLNAKN
ncbi:putative zinc-dependent oxidoreductase, partial [hydrothermal vent metagenome]